MLLEEASEGTKNDNMGGGDIGIALRCSYVMHAKVKPKAPGKEKRQRNARINEINHEKCVIPLS